MENDKERGMWEFFFETLVTGDGSQAILNQEKRGQSEFVNSEVMPHDGDWEILEAWGVARGDIADDLFVYCTLPDGWKKEETDHSMHSSLIDDKGHNRAGIFYKAAFYDRSAHFHTNTRYNATYQPVGGWENHSVNDENAKFEALAKDGETIVWRSDPISVNREAGFMTSDIRLRAEDWLDEHFPDWKNKLAYWD